MDALTGHPPDDQNDYVRRLGPRRIGWVCTPWPVARAVLDAE